MIERVRRYTASVAFVRWVAALAATVVLAMWVGQEYGFGAVLAGGFVLGAAQLWALRGAVGPETPGHRETLFVLATGVGWALALLVTAAAGRAIYGANYYVWAEFFGYPEPYIMSQPSGPVFLPYVLRQYANIVTGWALAGATFGAVQGLGLRPFVRSARWWAAATALAAALGGLLLYPLAGLPPSFRTSERDYPIEEQLVHAVLSAAIYAVVTGAVLYRLLRRPTIAAEGTTG